MEFYHQYLYSMDNEILIWNKKSRKPDRQSSPRNPSKKEGLHRRSPVKKLYKMASNRRKQEPADTEKCNKSTGEGAFTETIPFLMHRLKRGAVSKETSIRYLIYIKENDPGNSIS